MVLGFIGDALGFGGGSDEPDKTEEEKALSRKGAREWNRYLQDIVPLSDVFADNTKADESAQAGIDRGVVASTRSQQPTNPIASATRAGATTGDIAMALQDRENAAGRAIARGSNEGASQLLDRETRGLMSLAASGRNIQNQGTRSLAQAGQNAMGLASAEYANDQALSQGLISAGSSLAGTYMGQQPAGSSGSSGVSGDGGARAYMNGGMG